ncbi:MAG TPA: hypothetical protein VMM60_18590 [Ilumatobacter sp.]|nr:hypothetical protein [Ilumatobacter sp.]
MEDPLDRLARDSLFLSWARALASAGWLILLGYLMFLVALIRRASAISSSSFEDGVWGQRFEVVAFAALPQNVAIVVLAAAAAVGASVLASGRVEPATMWITQLVRTVAGTAYVVALLGILGIVDEFWQTPDSISGTSSMLNRVGGLLMVCSVIRLCFQAERGSSSYTPRSPKL